MAERVPSAPNDVLEQHRRALRREQAGLDLRHLEMRRDRRGDAHQTAALLQPVDEFAKRGVRHARHVV